MKTHIKSKFVVASLIASCLILPVALTTGCKTVPGQSAYTIEKAQKVAAILKGTAASGVVLAYTKDPNSTPYFKAAALALGKFATGSDLSPTALQLALQETGIRELKTPEAAIAMNLVISIYEAFWGDLVRDQVSANPPLKITLQGLVDGLVQGVQDVEDIKNNRALGVSPRKP
jgi:hypothetical protein